MKVRMRTTLAGPTGVCQSGGIVDLAKEQAYDLIERGFAEQIDDADTPGGSSRDRTAGANSKSAKKSSASAKADKSEPGPSEPVDES